MWAVGIRDLLPSMRNPEVLFVLLVYIFTNSKSVRGSEFNAVRLLSLFSEIKSVYFMFAADIFARRIK